MDTRIKTTALLRFLEKSSYYGKIEELHDEVEKWLSYIPHGFPHYTRHTILHSIEIIKQISSLLFIENDPERPLINLSPTEAYILVASAYLHDAGMVASDQEKSEIIISDDWRAWTSGKGGGNKRWQEIQAFRSGDNPPDENLRNFLADIQIRFLLAEFIRRNHHQRSHKLITLHQSELGRFAFDDPILLGSIADICVAHGLSRFELKDSERFPDRRDIRGDQVNLQFLATLLRLGDLLDLSHDRACPLLLNAASPLPADSLAHWTQYQRITHRLTATDKIEITAKCRNQKEHRYLRDWCQWLVDEIANATVLKAHWKRHSDWRVPTASLEGDGASIKIQPAPGASYIFGDWKLELDQEAIFQRLIFDVHDQPWGFLLELLQNSLDATRCRMYLEYAVTGQEPPDYPTKLPEDLRTRFPVRIILEKKARSNHLSGEQEPYQMLTIEDNGIGMDREIIQNYFLQVGRSYYNTDAFRRRFKFSPTSRFGIGFLSVFASSDFVEVETNNQESADGPISLTLTGPRNYLLMDKGRRTIKGTKISVVLRKPFEAGKLTELIRTWCRFVEIPILVNDLGNETIIKAESPEDFIYEMPLVTEPNGKFIIRSFPINRSGIEGEFYIFALCDNRGESWVSWKWAADTYPDLHPNAYVPVQIQSIYCINGIAYNFGRRISRRDMLSGQFAERLDYRKQLGKININRNSLEYWEEVRPEIDSRWQEIINQHIAETDKAKGDDSWIYKQRLKKNFDLSDFWEQQPGMIRIFRNGQSKLISLRELQEQFLITLVIRPSHGGYEDKVTPQWDNDAESIWGVDLDYLEDGFRRKVFANRIANNMRWLNSGYLAIDYIKDAIREYFEGERYTIQLIDFPDDINFYWEEKIAIFGEGFINKRHLFVEYLGRLKDAIDKDKYNITKNYFRKLIDLIVLSKWSATSRAGFSKLENYLIELKKIPELPEELKPPEITFTWEIFHLRHPDSIKGRPTK